jgi:hypothetical protein
MAGDDCGAGEHRPIGPHLLSIYAPQNSHRSEYDFGRTKGEEMPRSKRSEAEIMRTADRIAILRSVELPGGEPTVPGEVQAR